MMSDRGTSGEAIEAVLNEQALDFATIQHSEGSSALPDAEWDVHRVYFNEFTTQNDSFSQGRDGLFPLFEVNKDDDVVLEPLTESELNKHRDDTLDPLGWPRQVASVDVEEQQGNDLASEWDNDDENLLCSHRRKSDDDDEKIDKSSRLAQYAVVEPDEASLAARSSSENSDSDSEDGNLEDVGYQSQESDEESDVEICDQFEGFKFNSSDELGAGDNSSPPQFQAFTSFDGSHQQEGQGVPLQSSGDPDQLFEVKWEVTSPDHLGSTSQEATTTSAEVQDQTDPTKGLPTRTLPLLKPPPQEKEQKWLAERGIQLS
jgi:hypothetical protein